MTSVSVVVTTAPAPSGVPVSLTAIDPWGSVVASVSGTSGQTLVLSPPSPKLWSPDTPHLYSLTVKLADGTDSVASYFALREFKLVEISHPGEPLIPPQSGVDRPGWDLSGMPKTLAKDDINLCWQMCNETAECVAWAYAIQKSGCSPTVPSCWLKSQIPGTLANGCRASGVQAVAPSRVKRPALNGKLIFMNGWLDQSYWPDGIFTAPSEEALRFDLEVVKEFGFNTVRLHQKVNSERWYYHADRLGIIVMQDMPQKYGKATKATVPVFKDDMIRMVNGLYSHPCIVQWTAFNEGDCWAVFDVPSIVDAFRALDPTRPVDADSGGAANDWHLGDVNDIHTYPWPGDPKPSKTQYAMIGEYGGMGAYIKGHEWVPGKCYSYMSSSSTEDQTQQFLTMIK
jgi:hypothetical protein